MAQDWNLQTGTATKTSWTRSWRQELKTDLGSDFTLTAYIEDVTTLDSGEVVHTALPFVSRSMSQVSTDPDVILLNEVMTRLIKKWMDEDVLARQTPQV